MVYGLSDRYFINKKTLVKALFYELVSVSVGFISTGIIQISPTLA